MISVSQWSRQGLLFMRLEARKLLYDIELAGGAC